MLRRCWPLALIASASLAGGCRRSEPRPSAGAAGAAASASAQAAVSAPVAAPAASCAPALRVEAAGGAGAASSSVALLVSGGRLMALVADFDEQALHAVDVQTMQQVGVTPLPGRPGHVLVLRDGGVAVALRDAGKVLRMGAADEGLRKPLEERCAASVAAEPWALAEADEGRLLVASGAGAALAVVRGAEVERVVPLPREPRALVMAGGVAFVSHAVGGALTAVNLAAAGDEAERVDLRVGRLEGSEKEPKARMASQGHALAAVVDAKGTPLRLFAPHTSVDPGAIEAGPSAGYGGGLGVRIVAPIVSVVDPVQRRPITVDAVRSHTDALFFQDCLLPRGAAADDESLFVACADLDALLDLDPWVVDPIVAERRRIALPSGPSAVALARGTPWVLVHSEFDRALSRLHRATGAVNSLALWRRSGAARDAKIERGRRLFHATRDARIAKGRACASCHPDGRDDGLVWTSPNGPRQTLSLAGRLGATAPFGWSGEHRTLREHVKVTFGRLGGSGFDAAPAADDLDALLAYVEAMPGPPPPGAHDLVAAERGKAVFASAGCDNCHKGGGSNGLAYDLGTGTKRDQRVQFDTPSLRGVRATAPYFHDGRYASLDALLSATDNRMIPTPLSEPDKKALIAYLETL